MINQVTKCPWCGSNRKENSNICDQCGYKFLDNGDYNQTHDQNNNQNNNQAHEQNQSKSYDDDYGKNVEANKEKIKQDYEQSNTQASGQSTSQNVKMSKPIKEQVKGMFDSFVNKVNNMAGESGPVDLQFKYLVSDVFKKHTVEERDNIFICGTSNTTPKEDEILEKWPKPWLYSRVFLFLAIIFISIATVLKFFNNVNGYPGVIFMGSLVIPMTLLIFFWELNAPRNISIIDVVKIFFIGGVFSILSLLVLNNILNIEDEDYIGTIVVAIIEEIGKVIVLSCFLKSKDKKYILNGLLLGSALGAGFAMFETAGFAFNCLIDYRSDLMAMELLYLKGIFSIGGQILWTAMCGAALVIVKGNNNLKISHFINIYFLRFFCAALVLHSIWNLPIDSKILYTILSLIAWGFILVLINVGLMQIKKIRNQDYDTVMDESIS